MSKVCFLILNESYIVRQGLISILTSLDFNIKIKESSDLENIKSLLNKFEPIFLLINPNDLPIEFHKKEINLKKAKIRTIGLLFEKHNNNYQMFDYIDFYSNEEALKKKFKSLINHCSDQKISEPNQSDLSKREIEITKLVALGFTNNQIAEKLFLSTHTVITHRKNITKKLGIKSVSGLTIYAILNNIITIEEQKGF